MALSTTDQAGRRARPSPSSTPDGGHRRGLWADGIAALVALALVAAATAAIVGLHWYTEDRIFAWAPPLFGHWHPHIGPGSPFALLIAVAVVTRGPELAALLPWRRLCVVAYSVAVAWTLSLALIGGWSQGFAGQLTGGDQYLLDVPRVDRVGVMLHQFTAHVLAGRPDSWITQVSGHPPGAFLVFIGLDRLGLGGGGWAATACLLVGCLAAVAVPATIRVLGDEAGARAVVPFAVLFPGAICLGVSADGLFAGVTAVAVFTLAWGTRRLATGDGPRTGGLACFAAGMLLGYGLFLSYGLVLMAPIALVACLTVRRRFLDPRALPLALIGSAAVIAGFAAAGFWWLDGYHLVIQRYYQDLGTTRPYNYWVWANVASLALSAGPVIAPGLRRAVVDVVRSRAGRPAAVLALAAALAIAVADKSGLSKAEVERIWLPFSVWLTAVAALLPAVSRRWWLAGQGFTALAVGHLVLTNW